MHCDTPPAGETARGPLIVDQPEDNLDNGQIADTFAPALLEDRRARQIAFTSRDANLVISTDAEQIALFESDGSQGRVTAHRFLCTSALCITKHVISTLEGGRAALRLRYQKYGVSSPDEDGQSSNRVSVGRRSHSASWAQLRSQYCAVLRHRQHDAKGSQPIATEVTGRGLYSKGHAGLLWRLGSRSWSWLRASA